MILLMDPPPSFVTFCGVEAESIKTEGVMKKDWVPEEYRIRDVFGYSFPWYWVLFCCAFILLVIPIPALVCLCFRLFVKKYRFHRSKKAFAKRLERIEKGLNEKKMEPGLYYREKAAIAMLKGEIFVDS